MGKHAIVTVVNHEFPPKLECQNEDGRKGDASKKRRCIHPIRRLARLILGCGKKKDNGQLVDQEKGRTCQGASRWHNLLPFLEPLFTVDPKLLFIEDHILGRPSAQSSTSTFSTPLNLDELKRRVEEASPPCTCDECSPTLYKISKASSHGTISDRRNRPPGNRTIRDSFQNRRDVGLGPVLKLRFHGDYEAMTLVRHHVAWLDATYLHPSSRPTPSVRHLQSLLHTWDTNIIGPDMRHSISPAQLNTLFDHLNRVFFSGCVPPHNKILTAGFSYLPDTQNDCFGKSFFNPLVGTQILIHPTLYRGNTDNPKDRDYLDTRLRNRIGTILHEMCHAFLKAYTCRACPMYDACVGPRGHGRAWQVLAAKMEQVVSVVLGGKVDMGRFPSLLRDLEGHGKLPSMHDLEVYRFAGVVGGENTDLVGG
jgi:hypothetical protein